MDRININRKLCLLVFSALAGIFVFAVASDASAQGRYSNQYSRADVDRIIRNMEQNSDEFRTDFRREMNNSNLNSSTRNRFNGYVATMENSVDDLRRHFDRNDSWWESRSRVRTVVNSSQNVNTMMRTLPFRRNLERQWNQLRNQINRVADTFDLPGLDGGGWQGGPWNPGGPGFPGGGGQTSRPPNWAVGTFRSAYPAVTMTIAANGQVQSIIGGQTYYGRYYNGAIYSDNAMATVSRSGNGIRTYNRTTGQTIDFTRSWTGGGGDGGGWEGPTSSPPNWAVGTFETNDGIRMTIDRNGRVTTRIGRDTYYGRYYYGSIHSNGEVATVSRDGNGIRTYNRTTGASYNFRRR